MMLVPVFATALALGATAPKPFAQTATVEGMTEYTLPNGLKVVFLPDASKPTLVVNMTVLVGSRHEGYGEKGSAHILEHMLFKETKKYKNVKQALADHGGMANGSTWFDRTNFFEIFPASDENLTWAIELEADRLVNTVITATSLAPELTVVRNEFEMGESRPENMLEERLMSTAYLWHNYGNSTIGPKSDIEGLPVERIKGFYTTYYQPDNALLAIAGKFDETKAWKVIAETFGKIGKPKRPLPQTITVEPPQDGERTVTVRRVGGAPMLSAGYHVPAGTDPDYAAIDVIERVLGNAPAGRLYKALVETKKAAQVSCSGYQLHDPGYFSCTAELREGDNAGAARDTLLATIEGLTKNPINKEDVERAKTNAQKDIDLILNSSERIGTMISEFAAMGDWRMIFLHRDRIAALSPEDVNRVAAKYFIAANRTLAEYVPTDAPARAEIPAVLDIAPVLATYKGKETMAQGEAFLATPANIDARTTRTALGNGMKLALLAKKTRGETVNISLRFDYGSEKNLAGKRVAAEFAARMLMRGTRSKTRQQVKDLLDQAKARVHMMAHRQSLEVGIEVSRPHLLAVLDLVAECIKEPAFAAAEFETLRGEVISDAEQRKDDPMAVGSVALRRLFATYGKEHAFYTPTFEEVAADAKAIQLEAARDFHARFYGAQNGYAALVGDFDASEVKAKLEALFGGFKATESYAEIPRPFQALGAETATIALRDKPNAFYVAGVALRLKDSDADYPALRLADYMLGGGFLTGRISKRLRDKEGLSYGVGTFLDAGTRFDRGVLGGYAIYAPQNFDKIDRGMREELERAAATGFTAEEVTQASKGLLQDRLGERGRDDAMADALVEQLDLGRTMAFEAELDTKLAGLKAAEVGAAAKKYIDVKLLRTVRIGDFKPTGKM